MAKAIKVSIMHTATITKADLHAVLKPYGIKEFTTIANRIYDLPMSAPDAKASLTKLIGMLKDKGVRGHIFAMNTPEEYFAAFDAIRELMIKLEDCMEHGQGLSMYEAMRLELLHCLLEAIDAEDTYENLSDCASKWLSAI